MTLLQTIERLEELAKAATPGQWIQGYEGEPIKDTISAVSGGPLARVVWGCDCCEPKAKEQDLQNAAHIAATNPATILKLCAAVRELSGALLKLKSGPGNETAGWKLTWAHSFADNALSKLDAMFEEVRG